MSSKLFILNELLMIENKRNLLLKRMSDNERKRRELKRRRMIMFLTFFTNVLSFVIPERTIWSKVRCSSWWDNAVLYTWDPKKFKENFRVQRRTFDFLCQMLRPSLEKKKHIREPISVQKQVAVTLAKLGSFCDLRLISDLFGIARSTVCLIVNKTCRIICSLLKVKFPNSEEFHAIALKFIENGELPGCVGSLDGCHIPIKAPSNDHKNYFCQKSFHSIILQGLVDAESKFLNVYVGWPGSVQNAWVFLNSQLFHEGEKGNLLPSEIKLESGSFTPFIVADTTYPLLSWLIIPFSGPLTSQQENFNTRLGQSRMKVEHAFSMLKARFRSLLKQNDSELQNVVKQVETCCILHNICCNLQDPCLEDWDFEVLEQSSTEETVELDESIFEDTEFSNISGTRLRNRLLNLC